MKPERWQQVKEIFTAALEVAPERRAAFLAEVSADSDEVRRDVEILLHSFESGYLEKPIVDKIAEQIIENQLTAGQRIKHYEIREKIGTGGMGEVYLAQDTRLQRPVAIKFLLPDSTFDAKAEKRLLREAQSAAVLNHPNICTIHEIGESENRSFIVMEYVEGETLDARIRRESLSIGESLAITLNIANALTEAHSRGIVHRDIKPSNVIISSRGQVKVLDFSLAKKVFIKGDETTLSLLSQAGVIAGTIAYMSPEQVRGQKIDARSDIWSLGVVLYEMLTGYLPFAGETKSDIIAAILQNEPVPFKNYIENPIIEAERIVGTALQKNRDERYQTAEDFAADLRRLQRQLDSPTEFESNAESNNKAAIPSILERRTTQLPKIISKEPFEINKSTASEINQATDERETRSSVEYIAAKIKTSKIIAFVVLLTILSGISVWQIVRLNASDSFPFTANSRANLQISTLFSTKRKPNGAITDLSFSPDGNLFLFLLSGEGKSSIFVKQINGGEPVRVTDGKWVDQNPVWSPDGQRIAFVSNRDNKSGIWTVSYLGGTPVLQTPLEFNPNSYSLRKWSNDGKRIFLESSGILSVIELSSGKTYQISLPEVEIAGSFGISADEQIISYVVINNSKEEIWIQFLQTGEARAVSKTAQSNWSPVFFPDNQRIAYSSNQNGNFQIYVTDLLGSEQTQITFGDSNANNPTLSPDGKKMIYVSELDEANIFSLDLKTSKELQQTSNTKMQLFPNVSPNNEKMVFQVIDDEAKIYSSPVKIKTLGTENEPNQISQSGGWAKWSPMGEEIGFLRFSGVNVNIWKINVADQKEKQLTFDGISMERHLISPYNLTSIPFSWSPDGRKIVFIVRQSELYNLWTINEDGLNAQMITNNNVKDLKYSSPVFSPDGTQIAFLYRLKVEKDKFQYGVSIITNEQTKNIFESYLPIRILGWSKNRLGIYAAVKNQDDVDLLIIPINSNAKPKTMTKLKGANFDGIFLSPDSQTIVFSARRTSTDNIFVYSTEGKELQLTSNQDNTLYYSGLTWSPDGNSLFYSKQSGGMQISMISDSK